MIATSPLASRSIVLGGAIALGLFATSCRKATSDDAPAALSFIIDGKPVRTLTKKDLIAKVPPETVTAYDPYYAKPKRFRALRLTRVLEAGFDGTGRALASQDYVFRASDGYTVPVRGPLALEDGAFLAIEDLDVPGWEPIGPQHVSPGPFYLVWGRPEQQSLESHPRPWQLASIELARFESIFPHTSPGELAPEAPAARGFAIFKEHCIKCHAVNREGGRVGPELNVPQSIVEYRPEAQVRAYVKNPAQFRYGNMPAHPGLSEADLDALIAYFVAMKSRKHDVDAASDAGAAPAPSSR